MLAHVSWFAGLAVKAVEPKHVRLVPRAIIKTNAPTPGRKSRPRRYHKRVEAAGCRAGRSGPPAWPRGSAGGPQPGFRDLRSPQDQSLPGPRDLLRSADPAGLDLHR